ncbi:hypothetical protein H4R34_005500 [Dimargaris verticillata]|uniref:Proline-rich protein PRCC n=1 Tax=Dimargaris verticillata TaxID=2761393 RepID=A0A9W8B2T6_9FUNG|nr:hypothetical protein H4R34_005500 [Dimargaris verticillata]
MSLVPEYDSDSSSGESDGSLSPVPAPSAPTIHAPSSDSTTRKRVTIVVDLPKGPTTSDSPTDTSPPTAKKPRTGTLGLLSMLPAPKKSAGTLAIPKPAPPPKPRPTSPKLATAPADTVSFFPLGPKVAQAPAAAVPARLSPPTPRQVNRSPVPATTNGTKGMPQVQHDPNAQYRYAHTEPTDTLAASSSSSPSIAALDSEALRRLGGRRAIRELPQVQEVAQQSQLEPMAYLASLQHTANNQKSTSAPDHLKPSSQQKRKHNIMYLAYQAAESEAQLREHHASGHKTKRETQGKYGF